MQAIILCSIRETKQRKGVKAQKRNKQEAIKEAEQLLDRVGLLNKKDSYTTPGIFVLLYQYISEQRI